MHVRLSTSHGRWSRARTRSRWTWSSTSPTRSRPGAPAATASRRAPTEPRASRPRTQRTWPWGGSSRHGLSGRDDLTTLADAGRVRESHPRSRHGARPGRSSSGASRGARSSSEDTRTRAAPVLPRPRACRRRSRSPRPRRALRWARAACGSVRRSGEHEQPVRRSQADPRAVLPREALSELAPASLPPRRGRPTSASAASSAPGHSGVAPPAPPRQRPVDERGRGGPAPRRR